VDDHVVILVDRELLGVHRVVALEDLALLTGQPLRVALESVVDRLRDVEELLLAVDDPPLDIEARVAWRRADPGNEGLGIEFRCRDTGGLRRLKELVRRLEQTAQP